MMSGDFTAGKIGAVQSNQGIWMGIAILMLVPILMIGLSLTLP
jgi:hypothetical protein